MTPTRKPQRKRAGRPKRPSQMFPQRSYNTIDYGIRCTGLGFVSIKVDEYLSPKDCRRLAKWLSAAADYLESQAKG